LVRNLDRHPAGDDGADMSPPSPVLVAAAMEADLEKVMIMPPPIVVLDKADLLRAVPIGAMRKALHRLASHRGEKRPDGNGQRGGEERSPWDEVEAAAAEYAVAKYLHRFWPADFAKRRKSVDILPDIEVRLTKYETGHLLIYDEDNPAYKFVLVTGAIPEFTIRGWLLGEDAMNADYWGRTREDRAACFMVPQDRLRPIAELRIEACVEKI